MLFAQVNRMAPSESMLIAYVPKVDLRRSLITRCCEEASDVLMEELRFYPRSRFHLVRGVSGGNPLTSVGDESGIFPSSVSTVTAITLESFTLLGAIEDHYEVFGAM